MAMTDFGRYVIPGERSVELWAKEEDERLSPFQRIAEKRKESRVKKKRELSR